MQNTKKIKCRTLNCNEIIEVAKDSVSGTCWKCVNYNLNEFNENEENNIEKKKVKK